MSHNEQLPTVDQAREEELIGTPSSPPRQSPVRNRRPGRCRVSDQGVADCRRLLLASNQAATQSLERGIPTLASPPLSIERWPQEVPTIVESVFTFLPTAILFRKLSWQPRPHLLEDQDHCLPVRFLSAVYVCERIREAPTGRIKVVASRSFLLPSAKPSEAQTRADMLAALGKGVPLRASDGFRPRLLTGQLTVQELGHLRQASPEDQVAGITILAARGGPAVFLSEDGSWPSSLLLWNIAERLDRRIVRFNFDGVPPPVIRRIRYLRYEAF